MDKTPKHTPKIVSQDELILEDAVRKRALARVSGAVFLFLCSAGLIVGGIFPIIAKSVIPLMWLDYANTNGWTEEMDKIGKLLLANGRIEVIPFWVSGLCFFGAFVLIWLGTHIIMNRNNPRMTGDIFKLSYWMHFHWMTPPSGKVKVSYQAVKKRKQ